MNKNHKGLIEEYHRKEGGKRSNSTLNNYFLLIENVENIIVQDALEEHQSCTLEIISNKNKNGIENDNDIFEENKNAFDLFGEKETSEIDIEATIKEKSKVQAEREVSLYLNDTESLTYPKEQTNRLEW